MSYAWLKRACHLQFHFLIFMLPFEYYFGSRDNSLYTSLKLQVLILVVTWLTTKALGLRQDSRVHPATALHRLIADRLVIAVLTFVTIEILASIFAPQFRDNALKAGVKVAFGAFLALISADLLAGSNSSRAHVPFTLALSGTSMALLGFGERAGIGIFTRIIDIFQPLRYFLGNHARMISTMEYPNTAGSFLSVTICATLSLIMFPILLRKRVWKPILVVMILVQGTAIALTYSRGAVGAAIIAVALAAWMTRKLAWGKHALVALGTCFAVLLGGMAYIYMVRRVAENEKPIVQKRIAHYGLEAVDKMRVFQPGRTYREIIALQNHSQYSWQHGTYGVAYRWYSFKNNRTSPLFVGTDFPDDIAPEQAYQVPVSLSTPAEEGEYLLIWFVFHRSDEIGELNDSYSPGVLCVIRRSKEQEVLTTSERSRRYMGSIENERRELNRALVPGRWELWSAAIKIAGLRPLLGIGPDNFRMMKWTYMELPKGDETILANNLYLELLADSGLLGLLSFLWVSWEFGRHVAWNISPWHSSNWTAGYFGIAYLSGLLLHGFVDYFLKFTPLFLMFWLLLGTLCGGVKQGGADEGRV